MGPQHLCHIGMSLNDDNPASLHHYLFVKIQRSIQQKRTLVVVPRFVTGGSNHVGVNEAKPADSCQLVLQRNDLANHHLKAKGFGNNSP